MGTRRSVTAVVTASLALGISTIGWPSARGSQTVARGSQAGAAGSLSGAWLFGDHAPEPKQAVVSIPQRCWSGGVDFTLIENGSNLTGTARWSEPASGVARNAQRDESETLTGTRDGDHIVLRGHHVVVTTGLAYPLRPRRLAGERQDDRQIRPAARPQDRPPGRDARRSTVLVGPLQVAPRQLRLAAALTARR